MAQPVFDGHPLEEYFRGMRSHIAPPFSHLTRPSHAADSGDASEPMPGGTADFALQPYLTGNPSVSKHSEKMEKLCLLVFGAAESLSSFFLPDRMSLRTQAFAERFKYGVISSSLLSPAFATTPMAESHRRGSSPSFPGKLSHGHSRTPSAAESTMTDTLSLSMPPESEAPLWPLTLLFAVAVAALSAQLYFFAVLLFAGTLYYIHTRRLDIRFKPDVMTPSLLALQHLVSAGRLWDNVTNDAFNILVIEEQSIFCGPASPRTPSSLRVALSTSLMTTQTQCDNVRQLFSAITSPSELAQLTEMYAPPSPIKSTFLPSSGSHRPLSHPGPSPRTIPLTDRMKKRSTWNGSYASLALAGTPSLTQHREKQRSDLSILLGTTSPTPARTRLRNAPSSPPQLLADVSEEEERMVTAESSVAGDEEEHAFGAAALGLYRNRVSGGLRAFELSQHSLPSSLTRGDSTKRLRTTMSPGSKYTSMHTTRHPLSLSSLHQSLQNALASKRFACSHLLALRFEDDEDEVYWEDVRSVMGLLTSTLVDASSRLSEALDEVGEQHFKVDDTASESASGCNTPSSLASPPPARTHLSLSQAIEQIVSFAPTPSHLSRFALHVDAISSALDDAREQLEQCIASLKEERTVHSPGHSSHPSTSSCGDVLASGVGATGVGVGVFGEPSEHPAIRAYERLRRELGLALRECERGREGLVHLVAPRTPPTDEEQSIPVPAKDGADATSNHVTVMEDVPPPTSLSSGNGDDDDDDDVSLTVVSPSGEPMHTRPDHHGPGPGLDLGALPGIEQVFEAESGGVCGFSRERSKLSREERIKLVRVKRGSARLVDAGTGADVGTDAEVVGSASLPVCADVGLDAGSVSGSGSASPSPTLSPAADGSGSGRELWGPSSEVVQELRDVIWKVGERRRKMTARQLQTVVLGSQHQQHPHLPAVSSVNVDLLSQPARTS